MLLSIGRHQIVITTRYHRDHLFFIILFDCSLCDMAYESVINYCALSSPKWQKYPVSGQENNGQFFTLIMKLL